MLALQNAKVENGSMKFWISVLKSHLGGGGGGGGGGGSGGE